MKKIIKYAITALLAGILLFSAVACASGKGVDKYQMIFDKDDPDWDYFSYGKHRYNSYLLFCPKETPDTLTDFYYYAEWCIDYNLYAVYYTCKLSGDAYRGFVSALSDFKIERDGETRRLLKDDTHFSLPAYVIQWYYPNDENEVLEYFLLDDENDTVVFVYTMSLLDKIDDYSDYDVKPNVYTGYLLKEEDYTYYKNGTDKYFSVYFTDMEGAKFDLSLLEYLFT